MSAITLLLVLIAVALLFALATLAASRSATWPVLVACRLVTGVGIGGTMVVGLILSFVTMLSVLSVPIMVSGGSPTMMTVDVAYRINTFGDYAVANALCLLSLVLAAGGAWFYLHHAVEKVKVA